MKNLEFFDRCVVCNKVVNGYDKNLINNIAIFLKNRNINIDLEKLDSIPICRYDLCKLISEMLEEKDKSLAGLFNKIAKIYYFEL